MDVRQCRLTARVAVTAAICLGAAQFSALVGAQQVTRLPIRVPLGRAPGPPAFVGRWDYNAEESVDATTGRREQSPAQRRHVPAGGQEGGDRGRQGGGGGFGPGSPAGAGPGDPMSPTPGRAGGASDPNSGFGGGGGGGFGGFSGSPITGLERADTIRDLLEVPERLTIAVTGESVTFVDDLNRARTYLTDNRKKKYQLGAATYNAKTRWDGPQLKQDVSTSLGLKMSETFFLSEDAKRLFVVIRIGEPIKGEVQPGVNRVYDRIDRP